MHRFVRGLPLGLFLLGVVLSASPVHAQITIHEARNQGAGSNVTVDGTVTRAYGSYVRLQDGSGPTGASALVIRQTSGSFHQDIQDGTIARGTTLEVSGTLSEFNGLLQINGSDLSGYTVQGSGSVPAPQSVSLSDIASNGEDYESELVRIPGLSIQGTGTFSNETTYSVTNGSETLPFRVQTTEETALGGTAIPNGAFDYEGVVGEFRDEYQLIPIRTGDLQPILSFRLSRLLAMAQEGSGTVSVSVQALGTESGDSVSVTTRVANRSTATTGTDVTGFDGPQTLSFSGSDPDPEQLTFTVSDDTDESEGVEHLEVVLESKDGTIVAPGRFTLWVLDDPTAQGRIVAGAEGKALVDSLTRRYGNPPTLGYDVARDSLYRRVYNETGTVEGFYSGFEVSVNPDGGDASSQAFDQGVNTEHVWPQSKGAGNEPARSNLHILVPARDAVNSARSNYAFGEIPDADTDSWYFEDQSQSSAPVPSERAAWSELDSSPGARGERRFEPRHRVKGNVARAVFYFVTAYPNRADRKFFEAQKETLYKWHLNDPVDATEMRRHLRQASYQGNELNPFVVDSTLAGRAFVDSLSIDPPGALAVSEGDTTITLSWSSPLLDVRGYHVYRSTASFDDPSAATRLTSSPIAETQYTDTAVEVGTPYVYGVTAVGPEGNETTLSNRGSALLYPDTVSADVRWSFDGPLSSDRYRLVALPGQVDRDLASTLNGEAGSGWQAYWDDGTKEDFLVSFDGTQQFFFRPGRGFWLLADSTQQVTVNAGTVPLDTSGAVSIPLHDGWNIISNPLGVDVAWSAVQSANEGSLQSLWAWDGSYSEASTFASARSGAAYYFFNGQGLDVLTIPYAPSGKTHPAASGRSMLTLAARVGSTRTSAVRVGARSEAREGMDAYDQVAPPGRFGEAVLRLRAPGGRTGREQFLAREWRAPAADGHTFDLVLDAEPGSTVELQAEGVQALGSAAALVNTRTARRYDLSSGSTVQIRPKTTETPLRLIVGRSAYVDSEASRVRPDEVYLRPPAPNPVRDQATVTYAVPTATDVRVTVYDVLGRRVAVLDEGRREAGVHHLAWKAEGVASGVYLLRLSADGQRRTRKVMHVR